VSLPYRTVRNACMATVIAWVVIATASVPIWFTHHLRVQNPKADEQDQKGDELRNCKVTQTSN
jgi:hypothetical protein